MKILIKDFLKTDPYYVKVVVGEARVFVLRQVFTKMVQNCILDLPFESCGLLVGKPLFIEDIYKVRNIMESPVAFEMDSFEVTKILNFVNTKGEKFLGIYHSHPTAEPFPSYEDIKNFDYEDLFYFIVSLKYDYPIVGCFKIKDSKVIPVLIELI